MPRVPGAPWPRDTYFVLRRDGSEGPARPDDTLTVDQGDDLTTALAAREDAPAPGEYLLVGPLNEGLVTACRLRRFTVTIDGYVMEVVPRGTAQRETHAALQHYLDSGLITSWVAVMEVATPEGRYLAHRAGGGSDGQEAPLAWTALGMLRSGAALAEQQIREESESSQAD